MELAIMSIVIVSVMSQIVTGILVGRFIDYIEGVHKRESRKK